MKRRTSGPSILLSAVLLLLCAAALAGVILLRLSEKPMEAAQESAVESAVPKPAPETGALTAGTEEVAPADLPEEDETSGETAEPPDEAPTEAQQENISEEPAAESAPEALSTEEWARERLFGMTEEEKLYQLFVVTPAAVTGSENTTVVGPATRDGMRKYPVGGFIYQAPNIQSADQLKGMIAGQQELMLDYGYLPLLTCVDEEGGTVTRISKIASSLNSMFSYKDGGTETAHDNAVFISKELSELGLNTDLAPVADVWSNPNNTVIGKRAYSDDFSEAAALVSAAVTGFRESGIICTLKHFPGHGDTAEDSHFKTAIVSKTLSELENQEFLPFVSGIDAGADMVMIGHLVVTEVDPEVPATFSGRIVSEILRQNLGFRGVIITDALEMSGATNFVSSRGEACVQALAAGCDLLLGAAVTPSQLEECVQALTRELEKPESENPRLTWERIDESVLRVLALKYEHGLIPQ